MHKIWLPCSLTLLNLACGFFSLIFVIKGDFHMAIRLFLLAVFFDAIDGRTARYLNATSDFGRELDSLSDLVSFGIVPATLLYTVMLHYDDKIYFFQFILPAIFTICGALRLARYNIINSKDHFVGMPIPVAGGLLFLSVLYLNHLPHLMMMGISLALSVLMVSNIKIPRK